MTQNKLPSALVSGSNRGGGGGGSISNVMRKQMGLTKYAIVIHCPTIPFICTLYYHQTCIPWEVNFPTELHDVFTTWRLIRVAVPVEHTPAHRPLGPH